MQLLNKNSMSQIKYFYAFMLRFGIPLNKNLCKKMYWNLIENNVFNIFLSIPNEVLQIEF